MRSSINNKKGRYLVRTTDVFRLNFLYSSYDNRDLARWFVNARVSCWSFSYFFPYTIVPKTLFFLVDTLPGFFYQFVERFRFRNLMKPNVENNLQVAKNFSSQWIKIRVKSAVCVGKLAIKSVSIHTTYKSKAALQKSPKNKPLECLMYVY